MSAIYRYEVPVDDQWHAIEMSGEVEHVGSRGIDVVEFWALHTGRPLVPHYFRVFGTGHLLPEGCTYRGTTVAPGGALVWHLVERPIYRDTGNGWEAVDAVAVGRG